MNISAIVFPQITTVAASAVAGVNAISLLTNSPLANVNENASIVDLSKFGLLLSAINNLQMVATQPATASTATGQGASFGTFIAATELFVNAFNDIQSNYVDATQNSLGTSFNYAVQSALNTQSTSGSGKTLLASLAEIGINYQTATSIPGSAGQFTIDLTTLQTAYSSNPTATASSLKEALKALGQVAAQLVVQNANLFTIESNATLTGNVPNSRFDLNALAASIATLSPANAAAVNTALQHLLNDQALAEAVVETQAAASAALAANAETTTPATNSQAQVTFAPATGTTAGNTGAASTVNPVETATTPQGATTTREMETNANQTVVNAVALEQPLAAPTAESAAATMPALPENGSTNVPGANASNGQPTNFTLLTSVTEAANATVAQSAAVANAGTTSVRTTAATAPVAQQGNNAAIIETAATNPAPAAINAPAGTAFATVNILAPNQAATPVSVTPSVATPQAAVAVATTAAVSTVALSPSLSDPSYAAAVAAYHVNDAMLGTQNNVEAEPSPEPVSDVVEVTRVRPTTLNLHEGSSYGGRGTGAHHAGNVAQAPESAAPSQHSVDIAV